MDKLGLMASFVAVVEQGSYTAAAKQLGKTKAIVSKQVNQLEELLSTRLINRTTRHLSITDSGRALYDRCRFILDEVASLEAVANGHEGVAGRLRISAPQSFGELQLMQELSLFQLQYPELNIDVTLSDHYVDIIADGFDVALRIGQMDDSNLIAKQVSSMSSILVANPELAHQYSHIACPNDLTAAPCIHDSNRRSGTKWSFIKNKHTETIKVNAKISVNSAIAAYQAAIHGMGFALLPDFAVKTALQRGDLIQLLPDYHTPSVGVYIVYPHRNHLSTEVKVFIEFLANRWQV